MSALPTPDAIRSLASNMRRMDLLEWIERSGIATARDEKVDKDYLVERLSAAYKIAHKYSPTPVKPYVETKTFSHQRLEAVRSACQIPVLLFRNILHLGQGFLEGGFENPVVPFVDRMIGGVKKRASAGVVDLDSDEEEEAARIYTRLIQTNCRRLVTNFCDRRIGAKLLGDTAERLSAAFEGSTPQLFIQLMASESEAHVQAVADRWKKPVEIEELKAIWVLARWGFGIALGHLNVLGTNTQVLHAAHLLQLPDWCPSTVRHSDPDQPLQTLLAYRWFSDQVAVESLKLGIAPRPFDPIRGGRWDSAERSSSLDAEAADQALVKVASRRGIAISDALRAIQRAPFEWSSWKEDTDDLGTVLMIEILTHLREERSTAFGPIPIIWRVVHRYLDPDGVELGRNYKFSDEDKKWLQDAKINDSLSLQLNPVALLARFPEARWHQILFALQCTSGQGTVKDAGSDSDGGYDDDD